MLNQPNVHPNGLLVIFSLNFSQSLLSSVNGTFRKVAEARWGRDGGQVVHSHPDQVLALALRVETLLLRVPGRQEGARVEALPRELDDLLRLDPAAVHKLEALQVDDLRVSARHARGQYGTTICTGVDAHAHAHTHPPRRGTLSHLPGWAAASRGPASWWPAGASCTLSSSRARPRPVPPRW